MGINLFQLVRSRKIGSMAQRAVLYALAFEIADGEEVAGVALDTQALCDATDLTPFAAKRALLDLYDRGLVSRSAATGALIPHIEAISALPATDTYLGEEPTE